MSIQAFTNAASDSMAALYELFVAMSLSSAGAIGDHRAMDHPTRGNWAAALQTVGSFFVTVVALMLGLLDALCGAKSAIGELALATAGAAAFASSLSITPTER